MKTHTQERHMYGENQNAYGKVAQSIGVSGASQLGAKGPGILDAIGKSVSDARQQVNDLAMRARGIADEVFGAMPESESGSPVPPFSGKAGAVDDQIRGLFDTISELRTQIDRLSCI